MNPQDNQPEPSADPLYEFTDILCSVCHTPLYLFQVNLCKEASERNGVEVEFHHQSCFSQEVKARAILDPKIMAYVIDSANAARLSIFPIVGTKRQNTDHWFDVMVKENADKSFAEMSLLLGALEGASAACQFILNNIKKKQNVLDPEDLEEQRIEHVRKRDQAALKSAEKQRAKDDEKKKLLTLSPEEALKYKQDKKTIDTLMGIGLSKEEALARVDDMRKVAEARKAKGVN